MPEIDWPNRITCPSEGIALQAVCMVFKKAGVAFKVVMGVNKRFKFVFRTLFDFLHAQSILRSN